MSFEQIQLDPYFLARIYTQPIIPGKKAPLAATPAAVPDVKFLGENQKNIALFIKNEGGAYLNEELFNLLTNILNACKLGMQDIALINIAHYPALSFTAWQSAVKMKQAVLFGIPPASMGLEDFPLYQVISDNGCQLLHSDDLYPISQDKMMKGRLWQGLKQLLGI
jgi:DNA polymerase III psi subunit